MKNIVIVSRAWYPNHQLLFDEIQRRLVDNVQLYYYLLSEKEKNRPWNIENCLVIPQIIKGLRFSIASKEVTVNLGVKKMLRSVNPDLIIITPWSEIGCFLASNFAIKNHIPSIGWIMGLRDWSPNLIWLLRAEATRYIAKKFLKAQHLIFVYGTKAKSDAIRLGVPDEKIVVVKHVINEEHFDYAKYSLNESDKRLKRQELLLDDRPLFICISQLVKRKGIETLLKAYNLLLQKTDEVQLLLIGEGPMRDMVIDFAEIHHKNFKWINSVPYNDVPAFYALSDFSVVPSYFDDWCTVVNESHCMKVPVICSDGAHASYDLIKHGETGLLYKAGDEKTLSEHMLYALRHPEEMKKMAEKGYNLIQSEWNTGKSVKIWSKYIIEVIGNDLF
ncbi:TPA: glycosyltransferase [Candidatus Poribacteria bacterium]|nr:glycosyltransferase [Candidatus Poribacteria bacterium]